VSVGSPIALWGCELFHRIVGGYGLSKKVLKGNRKPLYEIHKEHSFYYVQKSLPVYLFYSHSGFSILYHLRSVVKVYEMHQVQVMIDLRLMKDKMLETLRKMKDLKILVVGDVMLDRYIFGKVERISPEAPVPVVEVEREEFRLGGASNVANNLANLGVKTYLAGVVGADYGRHILRGLMKSAGIEDLTVEDPQRPTTEKARVVSLSQQLLRIDWEDKRPIEGKVLKELLERLDVDVDGVIVSDYAKGVVCQQLMERVKERKFLFP